MGKLLSVGLDVGTTTTQLVVSELAVENRANAFCVPEMVIEERTLRYQSPVIFTPLRSEQLVDGEAIAAWVEEQYSRAGITKKQVDTGAVIITGETSRKENAAQVLSIGTDPISGTAGELEYDQLVEFWGQFDPYTLNGMILSSGMMTKLLKVPELQNPLTGLNFQGTGMLAAPLGANLHRTSAVDDGMIIGIDSRYALEQVRAGEVLVEYDKLIDRQLERAAITAICGFGKICDGAAKVLTV